MPVYVPSLNKDLFIIIYYYYYYYIMIQNQIMPSISFYQV